MSLRKPPRQPQAEEFAQYRAQIPAQPSARKLDGLSVLGRGTRRRSLTGPQAARVRMAISQIDMSASETTTFQLAIDRPNISHGTSSQRTQRRGHDLFHELLRRQPNRSRPMCRSRGLATNLARPRCDRSRCRLCSAPPAHRGQAKDGRRPSGQPDQSEPPRRAGSVAKYTACKAPIRPDAGIPRHPAALPPTRPPPKEPVVLRRVIDTVPETNPPIRRIMNSVNIRPNRFSMKSRMGSPKPQSSPATTKNRSARARIDVATNVPSGMPVQPDMMVDDLVRKRRHAGSQHSPEAEIVEAGVELFHGGALAHGGEHRLAYAFVEKSSNGIAQHPHPAPTPQAPPAR